MKTISVMAQKGGAGKTTLSVHLAVLAVQHHNKVALVDLDVQRSAAEWWHTRAEETPLLVEASAAQLPSIIQSAADDELDYLIIDTPPHVTYEAEAACGNADFILVPCRPSVLDLRAISKTIDLLKAAHKPAGIVLNHCPASRTIIGESAIVKEARMALACYQLPVFPSAITQRVAFSHALIDGRAVTEFEPDGKAAKEISELWDWIKEFI